MDKASSSSPAHLFAIKGGKKRGFFKIALVTRLVKLLAQLHLGLNCFCEKEHPIFHQRLHCFNFSDEKTRSKVPSQSRLIQNIT